MSLIQVLSTRHTAIGTLRRGIVYDLDTSNHNIKKVITDLLAGENPALKEITPKHAKKLATEVVSLVPSDDPDGMSDKEKLAKSEAYARDLEADLKKGRAALEKSEKAASASVEKVTEITAERDDALTKLAEVEAAIAAETVRADVAETEVTRLAAELEEATKPVADGDEGKGDKS